jgi:hypothetical protein
MQIKPILFYQEICTKFIYLTELPRLGTYPPSHISYFLALPHGVSTFCKSSGKYKLSYPIFLLEQLNNRHAPGAKSLKLGSNLGAQHTLCLIRAVIFTPRP